MKLTIKLGVGSSEGLVGEVLPRFPSDSISEHSTGGHDSEEEGNDDREEELNDSDDESDLGGIVESGDVDGGTSGESEDDDEEEESTSEVSGVVPGGRDVGEFAEGGSYHDEGSDGST